MREITDTIKHADHRHPADFLEPEADQLEERPELLALRMMLEKTFITETGRVGINMRTAFNRFSALVWVLRPDLAGGISQTELAAKLGISRAALCRWCIAWSDLIGTKNAAMKSAEARDKYSDVQQGHAAYRRKGQSVVTNDLGERQSNQRTITDEERRLAKMRTQFQRGKAWMKPDKALACRRGLIDGNGRLTPAGQAWVEPEVTL